ncbi:MAG: hypothetical protein ACI8W8_003626 [Rhodothermales bacterium]|jgi:hypothetical protein
MNPESFSTIGYISVAVWIIVPLLLLLHHVRRPRGWLCHVALVLSITAFALAKVNSSSHVNRIQLDRSAEAAAAETLKEEARQAALTAREAEVAAVRFAEDGATDRFDEAGMDEADKKYMKTLRQEGEPEWKKAKKQRSGERQKDDSLEGMLDTDEAEEGLSSEFTEEAEEKAPVVMIAEDRAMADRLDAANLQVTRLLIVLAFILLIVDYLRRANVYEEAYCPLPLPSAWLNALTPAPALRVRPRPPRRDLPAELAWITKRGDAFVCITNPTVAPSIPDSQPRLAKSIKPVEILRVTDEISDDFVFEALWHGRCSFVVDSHERAEQMIARFVELMAERRSTRAVVSQTVHVLWDIDSPLPETQEGEFAGLAKATGLSLLVRSA